MKKPPQLFSRIHERYIRYRVLQSETFCRTLFSRGAAFQIGCPPETPRKQKDRHFIYVRRRPYFSKLIHKIITLMKICVRKFRLSGKISQIWSYSYHRIITAVYIISYAKIAQSKIASSAISMTISAEKRSGYASACRHLDSLFSGWVFGKAVPIARPYSLPGSKTVQTASI